MSLCFPGHSSSPCLGQVCKQSPGELGLPVELGTGSEPLLLPAGSAEPGRPLLGGLCHLSVPAASAKSSQTGPLQACSLQIQPSLGRHE